MKKLLIVVDYQVDFVSGTLGFPKAIEIEDYIVKKIEKYRDLGEKGQILFTYDTHPKTYMESQEGKNLPIPHCIEGEDGWQLYGKINALRRPEDLAFKKPTFGSLELGKYLEGKEYESIEICGVVTNICVISNMVIAKSALPEVPIIIDRNCVASYDEDLENKAIDIIKNLHGIII